MDANRGVIMKNEESNRKTGPQYEEDARQPAQGQRGQMPGQSGQSLPGQSNNPPAKGQRTQTGNSDAQNPQQQQQVGNLGDEEDEIDLTEEDDETIAPPQKGGNVSNKRQPSQGEPQE
jgi:hypothetical protein